MIRAPGNRAIHDRGAQFGDTETSVGFNLPGSVRVSATLRSLSELLNAVRRSDADLTPKARRSEPTIKGIAMKALKLALCAAAASFAMAGVAHAEDASVSFNVGLTSDYVFRGVSQTDESPALQGGVDVSSGILYG
eukprot:gene60318-82528_t